MRLPVPQTPQGHHTLNLILAWCWFSFGLLGLVDDVFGLGIGIDKSIPVLFGISVYANFVSHLSTAQAASAEVKIEKVADLDINADEVNVELE